MGVRRAVDMAYNKTGGEISPPVPAGLTDVFTMGPLIHSPQVLSDLGLRGVRVLDPENLPPDLNGKLVLIRAHGITPSLESLLLDKGARLVDATCPRVKASQLKVRDLGKSGYHIFLAGERDHGEIAGIKGYAKECIILANDGDAEREGKRLAQKKPLLKTALIGQTTISPEEYRAIGKALEKFFPDILILDTICRATRDRQDALKRLCPLVEAVIVAGGRDSANTRRLAAIAASMGKKTWLVESAEEIPPEVDSYKVLGLSAGASTPALVIDKIEAKLLAINDVE